MHKWDSPRQRNYDDTSQFVVPSDPAIDGNLDKPNAPISTHAGPIPVGNTSSNISVV